MSRRNLLYSVVLVLSLVLAGIGVYRQVDARRDPGPSGTAVKQRALVPAPLTVSLSASTDRPVVALGGTSYLAVNAAGEAVSEVRVYDGSALIGVQRFSPARPGRVSVQVAWPAVRSGTHVLHAQATGAQPDQVGHSAPLRVRVVPGVVPATKVRIAGNGRTPSELAAATGVALGDLTFRNQAGRPVPRPPASRPLRTGTTAEAPLAAISEAAPAPGPAATGTTIGATLERCRATVGPAGDGTVSVYELTGGSAGFTLLGTASAERPYVSGDLTPGPHVFVAGRGSEPADSAPVSVDVPSTCLAGAWSGPARILDGELVLPEPEPRVWVYLGVDGQAFQRVPATGSVPASFGTADLAGLVPTLSGAKVRMQVWRPGASASAPAQMVAESESTLDGATRLVDLLGDAPTVQLSATSGANPVELGSTTASVRFSWQSASQMPDGVIWQVLGRPLATADRNTAPPVLLATGFSADGSGGGIKVGSDRSGSFEVPAELLLAGRPASGPVEDVLAEVPTPPVAELVKPGSRFGATPLKAPTAGSVPTLGAGVVPIPLGDVYVRVLPVTGATVVGDASNTVAVTLPPLDPTNAGFTKTKVTFDPGRGANYELSSCVRITGTPKKADGSPYLGSVYSSDGTWCASDFDSYKGGGCQGWCTIASDLGSLVTFVGKVWDYIATAYNTVVDTLVTVIAKFNPFCATASVASAISSSPYADAASSGCEAIGKVVASVVVSVVLSSFGLPARLPTSQQLADVAEGDLTGLAVAYLDSLGVPCEQMKVDPTTVSSIGAAGVDVPAGAKTAQGGVDVCAAMIQQAVGAIRGEVKKAADAEVSNATGLPVPPEPQQMVLEPRGQYQGATVRVTAKPIDPATPKTARCAVFATGDVRDWKVGNYDAHEPRDIEPGYGRVGYHPFSAVTGGAPWYADLRLAPVQDLIESETISLTVRSSCFSDPLVASFPNVQLRPPLGRWKPGQAD